MKISTLSLLLSLSSLSIFTTPLAQAAETQLNLSASAQREVANDQISATFYQQLSHTQPSLLADRLNKAAAQGIALGHNYPHVQLSSSGYNNWPNYDKNGKIQDWQGRVEIQLKSRDFTQTAELMAKLQQNLLLQGLQFSVSDETRKIAEQAMIPEAIARLRAQAEIAAKSLGKTVHNIKELNIGNNSPSFRPPMLMKTSMATNADVAQPDLQPGQSQLQLQINGKVELK